jgi:uncharacterized protein YqhQ
MLILGMGTGTYATQSLRYFENVSVEGVEIDEKIAALAGEYFDLPQAAKVTVYDGRAYLDASDKLYDVIMVLATILGLGLALTLFLFLPRLASDGIEYLAKRDLGIWRAFLEGGFKVAIFVLYLALVSLMPDIRRTFEYHGAEHKSIACYEAGDELTPANAKNHTRFHPRCGTSFMFVMILIGIVAGILVNRFLPGLSSLAYTGIRLLILPLVVGIGYEFIMLAGKHDNPVIRFLSAPGLWMQRITTREPNEAQLEVAICALKYALVSAFPDFDREAVTFRPKEQTEKTVDGKDAEVPDSAASSDTDDAP